MQISEADSSIGAPTGQGLEEAGAKTPISASDGLLNYASSGSRWQVWKASAVAFTASGATLVLELVAGRLMAPWLGVNLYSWTSIIGVVLAGIALGNYLGGQAADRRASDGMLGIILLTGSLLAVLVLPLTSWVLNGVTDWPVPAYLQYLLAATFLFLLPSFVLGMVSPVVIKLTLADLGQTGSVVGKVYAWSTAGSILGTFLTGFVLIATFGTRAIVFGVAIVLLLLATLAGRFYRRPLIVLLFAAIVAGALFGLIRTNAFAVPCVEETQYYCIAWHEKTDDPNVRVLVLDHMVQSYNNMVDPLELGYGYERIYAEVVQPVLVGVESPRSLFIGGGGYTFPRWMQTKYPQGNSDVLEIDREVTSVAYRDLGIGPDLDISTYAVDARVFFVRNRPIAEYDIVFGDAFHNFAVPYHLTTLEFNELVKRALKPDGIYIMNLIDRFGDGEFLRAYVRTAQTSFENVYLLTGGVLDPDQGRTTFVVVMSDGVLDVDSIPSLTRANLGRQSVTQRYPPESLQEYLDAGRDFILTDDYVPVDNLLSRLLDSD